MKKLFFALVSLSLIGSILYPLHALALTSLAFFIIKFLHNDELDFKILFKFDDNGVHDHPFIKNKTQTMTAKQKQHISIHESGHLLVLWFSPEIKFNECEVAIHNPAKGEGPKGSTLERDITELHDEDYMLAKIAVSYGAHLLEKKYNTKLHDGHVTDLGYATNIANEMVTQLGMSPHFPLINLLAINHKFLSPEMKQNIQKAILEMLEIGRKKAEKIIDEKSELAKHLIQALLDQPLSKPLTMSEIQKILGPRPLKPIY